MKVTVLGAGARRSCQLRLRRTRSVVVDDLGGTASGGFYLAASDYVRIEAIIK